MGFFMGRPNRFQILNKKSKRIKNCFKLQHKYVFSIIELQKIFRENRDVWSIPAITKVQEFKQHLIEKKIINQIDILLPLDKELIKYGFSEPSIYEIALSIKSKSYLSHYTAMFLHELTNNIPKIVYTNTELKKTPNYNSKELEQGNVDRAFACNVRQSNQIAQYKDSKIYLLNSKNVDHIGVKDFKYADIKLQVTDVERTLIDITVRPNYAGGVFEVLEAYKAAKEKISTNRLLSILKKIDYTYPYHQAIGFYLEQAGYSEDQLKLVEKVGIKYNFYLTYKIKEKEFSERWKLFFPKGF